eukprot:7827710-Alexandrium_andersonii.AAC.1
MASRSVDGSATAAVLLPSQAAYRPQTAGVDAAPNARTRKQKKVSPRMTTVNRYSSGGNRTRRKASATPVPRKLTRPWPKSLGRSMAPSRRPRASEGQRARPGGRGR